MFGVCLFPADYLSTDPDPVAEFSTPILEHMNADHSETTEAMIKHYITGVEVIRRRCCRR